MNTEDGPKTYLGPVRVEGRTTIGVLNLRETNAIISSGAITFTSSRMRIDTEGGGATDSLTTINGGEVGDILILYAVSSARDITIVHNASLITLDGGNNNLLADARDNLTLVKRLDGSGNIVWNEICSVA